MCDYIVLPEGNLYSLGNYMISARRDFASILAVNGDLIKVMIKTGIIVEIDPKQECVWPARISDDDTLSITTVRNMSDRSLNLFRTCVINGMVYIHDQIVYTEIATRIKNVWDVNCNIHIEFKDGSSDEYKFIHYKRIYLKSITTNEVIVIKDDKFGYGRVYCNYGEMELVPFTVTDIHQITTFDEQSIIHCPVSNLSRIFRFGKLYLLDIIYGARYYFIDGDHQINADFERIDAPSRNINFTVADNKLINETVHYKCGDKYYLYNYTVILECLYKTVDYPYGLTYGVSVYSIDIYNGDTFIFMPMHWTIFTEFGKKIKNITFTDDLLYSLNITFKNGESIDAFMDYERNLRLKDGRVIPISIPGEYGQYREIPNSEITARGEYSIFVRDKCIAFIHYNVSKPNTKFLEWRGNYLAIDDVCVYPGNVIISPPPLRIKAAPSSY